MIGKRYKCEGCWRGRDVDTFVKDLDVFVDRLDGLSDFRLELLDAQSREDRIYESR